MLALALSACSSTPPDDAPLLAVAGAQPWGETAQALLLGADGRPVVRLVVDGREPVRLTVPITADLRPGPIGTLAVGGGDGRRWLVATMSFRVGADATCASVYPEELDLRALCEAPLDFLPPAFGLSDFSAVPPREVALGAADGCLVPALVGDDPSAWRDALGKNLAPFVKNRQTTWVVAARDTEPTAIVAAVAEGAAAAGLTSLHPAAIVGDASVPEPACAGQIATSDELDRAEARAIGAGTAARF